MKAVVTGVGFVGHHLVNELVAAGHDVHVIVRDLSKNADRLNFNATYHQVDIRSAKAVERIMVGADCVFHLAAKARMQQMIDHPIEASDINVRGTMVLLEAARQAGVQRFVFASTSAVYGERSEPVFSEDMIPKPMSPYGWQKFCGELLCATWFWTHGLQTVSLRLFNVYGPGLDLDEPYPLVVAAFLKQKRDGKPIVIRGNGSLRRDFVHGDDVVRAMLLAATSKKVGNGEVINIGSGMNTPMAEIARLIGGPEWPIEYAPTRLEPSSTCANIQRAKELLGWEPTVPLEQGLKAL